MRLWEWRLVYHKLGHAEVLRWLGNEALRLLSRRGQRRRAQLLRGHSEAAQAYGLVLKDRLNHLVLNSWFLLI